MLSGLPRFTAAGDDARLLRGRIVIAPGIDAMERAHDAAKYGRPSDAPILEATIPSLADPSLVEGAAPGTHVMSVIVQAAPYTPPGRGRGTTPARRSATGSSRRSTTTRPAWPGS